MKSLYVMKANGAYKIGVSHDPEKRLRDLGIGNCDIQLIYASKLMCNAYAVESALHKRFSNCSAGREWFHISDERKLLADIRALVDEIGVFEPDKTQLASRNEHKLDDLLNSFFEPERRLIRQLDEEIEEIWHENELLTQRLIELGWTQEEVNSLIEEAIGSLKT